MKYQTLIKIKEYFFLVYFYVIIMWIINLIKFINCDFTAPFRDEVIHALGLFIPPLSAITGWL